jgi:RND superfamily putative drug exporter
MTSSLTVALGLATLLLLPIPFMRSLGIAGLIVPLASLLAALTLQPALLSCFGKHLAMPVKFAGLLSKKDLQNNAWAKIAHLSIKWPKQVFAISFASLLLLGSGAFWLQLTPSAITALPQNLESAQALSLVTSSAGPGVITPAVIMVDFGKPGLATSSSTTAARKALTAKLSKDPEIFIVATDVTPTFVDATGQFMRIFVIGRHSLGAPETSDLVERIRAKYLSGAGFPAGTIITQIGAKSNFAGIDYYYLAFSQAHSQAPNRAPNRAHCRARSPMKVHNFLPDKKQKAGMYGETKLRAILIY